MTETQVSIRIDLETGGRIGPGKIALLEAIRKTGSITAAAINQYVLSQSVVTSRRIKQAPQRTGRHHCDRRHGGGSTLTPVGQKTIQLYHSIEMRVRAATRSEFQA
jgi:molybdate transport system regulatory protein